MSFFSAGIALLDTLDVLEDEEDRAPPSFFFIHGLSLGGGAGTSLGAGSFDFTEDGDLLSSLAPPSSEV